MKSPLSTGILACLLLTGAAANSLAAGETNAASRLDWKSFQIVAERNIFNQTRTGRIANAKAKPRVDSFTLLGTMAYEKGQFAFLGGTSNGFRKVLKVHDAIAGFKVTAIAANSITLARGNGEPIELHIGMGMKREEDGPWVVAGRALTDTAATSPSNNDQSSETPSSGAESDVLKRLMMKREQELKDK